jgi:putative ABC transport system substrate-binding protein
MRRREFIALLGNAAAWPLVADAQQPALPVVSFISARSPLDAAGYAAAFRKGLGESGYVGQNVTVEYHWLDGQYDRLPSLMADLVRRRVAAIATPAATAAAIAVKAATVPLVFGVAEDPVKLGLVASLPRPGGNATGINFFGSELSELVVKRLGLLQELVPKGVRIAVLVNPANARNAETTLGDLQKAAQIIGLQIYALNASTSREIDAALATLARDRSDALFVASDGFFHSRRVQFAILTARDKIHRPEGLGSIRQLGVRQIDPPARGASPRQGARRLAGPSEDMVRIHGYRCDQLAEAALGPANRSSRLNNLYACPCPQYL